MTETETIIMWTESDGEQAREELLARLSEGDEVTARFINNAGGSEVWRGRANYAEQTNSWGVELRNLRRAKVITAVVTKPAPAHPILSDDDLDRAALSVVRKQYGMYDAPGEVRSYRLYRVTLAALRETLGGAR